jgi:hypothetical protein
LYPRRWPTRQPSRHSSGRRVTARSTPNSQDFRRTLVCVQANPGRRESLCQPGVTLLVARDTYAFGQSARSLVDVFHIQ